MNLTLALFIAACFLPSSAKATDCAIGLVDNVGAIIDGYRNVLDGVYQTGTRQQSSSYSFTEIIGSHLKQDICDLETVVKSIFEDCKTCPGCNDTTGQCIFKERDVVFVLDSSSTLNSGKYNLIVDFASEIIIGLDKGDDVIRAAALLFATRVVTLFNLNDFKGDLAMAALNLTNSRRIRGGTNLASALDTVRVNILDENEGDRLDVDDTIIIIGDGESNAPATTLKAYNDLIVAYPDVEVVTVGVGILNETELRTLARPSDNFYSVANTAALESIVEDVLGELCPPCDPPCENGAVCDEKKNQCICASGFFGSRCQIKSLCT